MRRIAFVMAAALAAPADPAGAEVTPVRVHVTARTPDSLDEAEKKAREKETDVERKRAEKARKDLEKALAARHGKRQRDWPADARSQIDEAWREERRALLTHHEVKAEAKDLSDSAKDLVDALKGEAKKTPQVVVADSADQADLMVEVLARRSQSSFPVVARILYLKVTPRGGGADDRFGGTAFGQIREKSAFVGQILGMQRLAGGVTTLHPYAEAEPYWIIEVFQQGAHFSAPAQSAAEAIAGFAVALANEGDDRTTAP